MLGNFFALLILGHMVGDYLLQNKWMAMNKSASHFKCAVHCLLYTLAVVCFTWPEIHGLLWTSIVFVSHYPIDRWGLADKWLGMINSRSLKDFIVFGKYDIPMEYDYENYHALRAGFTSIVYVATDNTMHIGLMVLGWYLVK